MLKYYRFFRAYNYRCFCLFDCDEEKGKSSNAPFIALFEIDTLNQNDNDFNIGEDWGCFGVDFESYMRTIKGYIETENDVKTFLETASKPIIAKAIAENYSFKPEFIEEIVKII